MSCGNAPIIVTVTSVRMLLASAILYALIAHMSVCRELGLQAETMRWRAYAFRTPTRTHFAAAPHQHTKIGSSKYIGSHRIMKTQLRASCATSYCTRRTRSTY